MLKMLTVKDMLGVIAFVILGYAFILGIMIVLG